MRQAEKVLGGVLAPVTTPFDPVSGELAVTAFRANVRAHVDAGVTGIVVSGSTGEAPLLEEEERRRLVELARAVVPDDCWVVAGVGAESTRLTVRRALEAAERGADALLVVAPHYFGAAMTADALGVHFRRIADRSPVPVILYNIPKYAHFRLEPSLVAELSRHENIVGIKDSSGDLGLLTAYVTSQREDFTILTGNGGSFFPALEIGARGGILAVSLFAGPLSVGLYRAFVGGDRVRATRAQQRLTPLAAEIVGSLGVAGVKAAMDEVGLAGGPVRPPLLPLGAAERARVTELLQAADIARAA